MLGDKKKYLAKKNAVQKKLFTEQEKKKITDPPEPQYRLERKVTKKRITPLKEGDPRRTYEKEKEYQQGNKSPNVLSTVKENSEKKKPTGYKTSFNAADFTPPGSTEVNKRDQKRVNKILGNKKY